MERLNLISLKNLLGSIPGDNKEVRKISNSELAVILSDREFLKGDFPHKIADAFNLWKPKLLGNSVKIENFLVVVKKRSHQRKPKKRYDGLKNEEQFHEYLLDALRECPNCPLNVYFTVNGVTVFSVEGVKRVERRGQKDPFKKVKADEHLILENGDRIAISLKKENAASWESGDSGYRELAEKFWKWAVKNKVISYKDHPDNITKTVSGVTHKVQKLDRDTAFPLRPDLAKAAVFGTDIIPKGAVVVATLTHEDFTQDGENLFIECKHIFRKMEDLPSAYYPHFLLRNDSDRLVNKGLVIPAGIRYEIVTRSTGGKIGTTGRVNVIRYAH